MNNNNMGNLNSTNRDIEVSNNITSIGDRNKNYNKLKNRKTINNYYYASMTPEQLSKQARNQQAKPMLNGSERTVFKQLADRGERVWVYCYIVGLYGEYEEDGETYLMVTAVSIRYKNQFAADHMHLKIPKEIYNDNMMNKIIAVFGKVYNYKCNRFEDIEKQSILVEKFKEIKTNEINIDNHFISELNLNYNHANDQEVKDVIIQDLLGLNCPDERMFSILETNILLLENILVKSNIPDGYITKYILNQYVINRNPKIVNDNPTILLQSKKESAYEVNLLILSIIKRLVTKEIVTIFELFSHINRCLNSLHRLNVSINPTIATNKSVLKSQLKLQTNFKSICKPERLNVDEYQAYLYIKDRNANFGYSTMKCKDILDEALCVFGASNYLEILDLCELS